ncbi:MAG: MBL fold metallo-hydrolase [candidate division Zixibacteria bacterium]|nr:MBL fold metallo-hydrolase [candidate division Zixibacteria bacterium]
MVVTFWGVRGSIPTPGPATCRYGGNTPCVTVEDGNTLIVIDCGSGIRVLGNSLLQRFNGNPVHAHILISHTHWDHIQGFPFFIPAFIPSNTFTIYGGEGVNHQIEDTLAGQMESPYFPVTLKEMAATLQFRHIDQPDFSIDHLKVKTCFLNHPGVSLGYKISSPDGSVVYFSDHEPYSRLMATPSRFKIAVENGLSEEENLRFAQERDAEYTRFCEGVDLLIEDSPYTPEEYKNRAGWGHACIDDVVAMAVAARVKQLALFHHDPSNSDEQMDGIVALCQTRLIPDDSNLTCFAAQEGQRVVVPAETEK